MARARTAKHPQPVEEPQEITGGAGQLPSQAEMVRRAVAAGHEKPSSAIPWIKQEFGFDMESRSFSATKAQNKNRGKKGDTPARQPRPATPKPSSSPANGIVGDIAEIKRLLATHGRDGLEELIKVLS